MPLTTAGNLSQLCLSGLLVRLRTVLESVLPQDGEQFYGTVGVEVRYEAGRPQLIQTTKIEKQK